MWYYLLRTSSRVAKLAPGAMLGAFLCLFPAAPAFAPAHVIKTPKGDKHCEQLVRVDRYGARWFAMIRCFSERKTYNVAGKSQRGPWVITQFSPARPVFIEFNEKT